LAHWLPALSLLWCPLFFPACRTFQGVQPVPIEASGETTEAAGGISGEIRKQVEQGTPRSLARALEIIQEQNLGASEYGRVMIAVTAALFRSVYPDSPARYPAPDPPQSHAYTKILKDAGSGVYARPPDDARDFFVYILPFLAWYPNPPADADLIAAVPDLEMARALNPASVLPPLFTGFVYEKTGDLYRARQSYNTVLSLASDCYPAELGIIRVTGAEGRSDEALAALNELLGRYPDNVGVKKALARAYVAREDWSRAGPLITEILQRNDRDGEFLLLKAKAAMGQGRYQDAQAPLDAYAPIDSSNRDYLFLRARLQTESYHNRDSAINYLRSIIRTNSQDGEAQAYLAGLLMESTQSGDIAEGRSILSRLLAARDPLPQVRSLAVKDAIRREAWNEARNLLAPLLAGRRTDADLLDAYSVERGLGNNAAALSYARELYNRTPKDDDAAAAFITALIGTGRQAEASRLIADRIANVPGGAQKSRYYYLRSRLQTNEETAMSDLRSSLFENPRNLDALIAMFDIYHGRRDERRAVYYLKQGLALDPNNAHLKRYEAEYSSLLN
jgi:thioredoxin-like negative regulator of GroEL